VAVAGAQLLARGRPVGARADRLGMAGLSGAAQAAAADGTDLDRPPVGGAEGAFLPPAFRRRGAARSRDLTTAAGQAEQTGEYRRPSQTPPHGRCVSIMFPTSYRRVSLAKAPT